MANRFRGIASGKTASAANLKKSEREKLERTFHGALNAAYGWWDLLWCSHGGELLKQKVRSLASLEPRALNSLISLRSSGLARPVSCENYPAPNRPLQVHLKTPSASARLQWSASVAPASLCSPWNEIPCP